MSGFRTLEENVVSLCQETMGQDVDYTPYGHSVETIKGIFDNAYVDIEGVVSLKPVLRIKLDDLSFAPSKRDTVVIQDITYRVMESREDGFGGSTLILQR